MVVSLARMNIAPAPRAGLAGRTRPLSAWLAGWLAPLLVAQVVAAADVTLKPRTVSSVAPLRELVCRPVMLVGPTDSPARLDATVTSPVETLIANRPPKLFERDSTAS